MTTTESQTTPPKQLPPPKGPVLRDVMREHIEEIGVLRMQRAALRFSMEVGGRALARVDARIAAHRDGLAEGAPASVEVAVEMLEKAYDPWEVAAIVEALLAFGSPAADAAPMLAIESRLVAGPVDLLGGWFEGLRVSRGDRVATLARMIPELAPLGPRCAPLIGAFGWHGLLDKPTATAALVHDDAEVRRALARALGWSTPRDCDAGALLGTLHADADIGVRRRAAWSETVRSPASGLKVLRDLAQREGDPFAARALELIEGRKPRDGAPPEEVDAAEADRRALSDAASADPDQTATLLVWRVAFGNKRDDLAHLRRETPSCHFEDALSEEVAPGL